MHVAIIGAGLIGRLTALSLTRQGLQVTLFDKDCKNATQSAAYAAAGLLTPLGESLHCEPNIVEMGFLSLTMWPAILATLKKEVYFQQQGAVMVSHEQDQGDYQRFKRFITRHYPQHQVTSLNRQQLSELEPELAYKFNQGLCLPNEGQIDNRMLLTALQKELEDTQVQWFESSEVVAIHHLTSGCEINVADKSQPVNKTQFFDLAVDCRGIGASLSHSPKVAKPLCDLRAVRGELFKLFAPEVNLTRPVRLMHPRYQLYIAPKPNNVYMVGATEIESDDVSPMTVRSAMELLSAAYSVHSGFAEAHIQQHISQVRPAFSDNQPRINVKNSLIQVNGLYRHGFLISPVVLKQIEQAVQFLLQSKPLNAHNSKQLAQGEYSNLLPITFSEQSEII